MGLSRRNALNSSIHLTWNCFCRSLNKNCRGNSWSTIKTSSLRCFRQIVSFRQTGSQTQSAKRTWSFFKILPMRIYPVCGIKQTKQFPYTTTAGAQTWKGKNQINKTRLYKANWACIWNSSAGARSCVKERLNLCRRRNRAQLCLVDSRGRDNPLSACCSQSQHKWFKGDEYKL